MILEEAIEWPNATGTYLGRLAKRLPDRVQSERTGSRRDWRIAAENCQENDD